MSRDGWLPPGVTDADIDRAAPGYYDNPLEAELKKQDEILADCMVRVEKMHDRMQAYIKALGEISQLPEVRLDEAPQIARTALLISID